MTKTLDQDLAKKVGMDVLILLQKNFADVSLKPSDKRKSPRSNFMKQIKKEQE
jgi:hypothetical protein